MLKALVPVDGSSASERAVRHVIALTKGREPMDVHLLNVPDKANAFRRHESSPPLDGPRDAR